MARPCTVCRHPERAAIDKALVAGEPFRNLAERFGTSATALHRHKQDHLPALLAKGKQAEERVRSDELNAQARAQEAAKEAVALDVMGELRRLFNTGQKLRAACDEWLTDPDDPTRYTLEPRADEVKVIYYEKDDDKKRRHKASMDALLARISTESGIQVLGWESKHADPRELILKAVAQLTDQLEVVHKLFDAAALEERIAALEEAAAGKGASNAA